jgi:SAM-dependent methyltransferase
MGKDRTPGTLSKRNPRRKSGALRVVCAVFAILVALRPSFAAERVLTPDADPAWARERDKVIRARLEQGDLESMVNFLLLGASFTKQPRIQMDSITEASKAGVLRARVDDLVAGLRNPGGNERLIFLQGLLRRQGIDPESSGAEAGVFLFKNLSRVVQERMDIAKRAAQTGSKSPLDRESLFQDRGLSLDTSIIPAFTIEQTLRDLKMRGELRGGPAARVAVIGPGLDFIDKNEESAFDYYPPQTLQPFALYDSLVRLGLANPKNLSVAVFDISPRVIDHLQRARERARKNSGYAIQLPRDIARPWPQEMVHYWNSLGDRVGTPITPIHPPAISFFNAHNASAVRLPGLATRAVRLRPDVVLACEPLDLDIIVERLNLAPAERFDMIVATNIFVYYEPSEQTLALENVGAMLKPGGLLLTNDLLPAVPGGSMRQAGITIVPFDSPGISAHQAVGWYRKQ